MYNNIGNKIKTLATVIGFVGMIISLLSGIALILRHDFIIGVVVAVIGSLLSWISTFVLYGYGWMIENTDALVAISDRTLDNSDKILKICREIKKSNETDNSDGDKQ